MEALPAVTLTPNGRRPGAPRFKLSTRISLVIGATGLMLAVFLANVGPAFTLRSPKGIELETGVKICSATELAVVASEALTLPRMLPFEGGREPSCKTACGGTVVNAKVLVNEQGDAIGVKTDDFKGELAPFEDEVTASVMHARFEPARRRGSPITGWTEVPITVTGR